MMLTNTKKIGLLLMTFILCFLFGELAYLIIVFGYVFFSVKKIHFSIGLLLFSGLIKNSTYFGERLEIFLLAAFIIVFHFIILLIKSKQKINFKKNTGFILFSIYLIINILLFSELDKYSNEDLMFSLIIIPLSYIISIINAEGKIKVDDLGYAILLLGISYFGVLLYNLSNNIIFVNEKGKLIRSLSGFGEGYMMAGLHISMTIIVLFFYKNLNFIIRYGLIVLGIVLLFLNPSKGVILSLILTTIIGLYFRKRVSLYFVLAGGLLIIAFFLNDVLGKLLFDNGVINNNRLFSFGEDSSSAQIRMVLIEKGLSLFEDSPIFGAGSGAVSRYFMDTGLFLHNIFLQILSSFGILGLIYWGALIFPKVKKIFLVIEKNYISLIGLLYFFWTFFSGTLWSSRNFYFIISIL